MNESLLMDIAGISESEIAWSNIYAYFMDAANLPEYAYAFTNALLELSGLDRYEILPDNDYCVRTEVSTAYNPESSNSRIDILIEGAKSIIIENKINHKLDNPLDEYWDYAIQPAVLIILTISRISQCEIDAYCSQWNKQIKCVNITHYELITKTKELIGRDFENPILKELESIIMEKTKIMPDTLYIENESKRLEANAIYERELKRREMIVKECKKLKAVDESNNQILTFKCCFHNDWMHFKYRGQNDLVVGILCAYLWDWERYIKYREHRSEIEKSNIMPPPVITLFLQVHGKLYREMKKNGERMVISNGYDNRERQYCHIIDYDIDMTDADNRYCRSGELGSLLTSILNDKVNCKVLEYAERIYKNYCQTSDDKLVY